MSGSNTPAYHSLRDEGKTEINESKKILKDHYKICPKCGNFTNYSVTNSFCHICGTMFISECPDCKEPVIYPISKFCPVCGTGFFENDI